MTRSKNILNRIIEGNPSEKKFLKAVNLASNGDSSAVISVFLQDGKGNFTDLPTKFKDVKKAFSYIKGLDGSKGVEVRVGGTKVKDWV
jgi:hypothetical protein